jgi:hypothetical protein
MVAGNKTRIRRRKYRRQSRYRKRGGGADKLKVAILFYGRISSYEHSLEYINSIYKNPRFTAVVFCSLNLKNMSPYIKNFCKEFNVTDEQINIEPTQLPESYMEDPHNKTVCTPSYTNCFNNYSTYYHQNKAFKLMEEYQKRHNMLFDIVIIFRADMNSKNAPNVFPIAETIAPNTIYIAKPIGVMKLDCQEAYKNQGNNFYSNGLSTLSAYGNNEAMKKYTSLIEHKDTHQDHPEIMLFKHVNRMGLAVQRFDHDIVLNPGRKNSHYLSE